MTLHPALGSPVVDRLGPRDVPEVLLFLESDPIREVYLTALVLRDALARATDAWWGARRDGRLVAILFLGTTSGAVLPAGDDADALRALARALRNSDDPRPDRLQLIGPAAAVAVVREVFPGPGWQVRLEREQVYLSLAADALTAGEREPALRPARREDYAFVYESGADLRAEELLEDPRTTDPVLFARRVEEECRDGWTWLVRDARGLAFRAGLSALTRDAAQVSGVYVPPDRRGQGLATRALRELCARLLERARHVCLFVNTVNGPALAVYRRLGFRTHAAWASVFLVREQP
ncbi:MAG: GNAT family N-acetyltransferase [bacterium]